MSVWNIDSKSFPYSGSFRLKLEFLLQYAVLAPSAHNNQPWKVELQEEMALLKPDMEYVSSGTPRLTVITLGAFIENLSAAAKHFGMTLHVGDFPLICSLDKLCIPVKLTGENSKEDVAQFEGITLRHTNRGLYTDTLHEGDVEFIRETVTEPETSFVLVEDEQSKKMLATLASKGVRIAVTMPPLRRELAHFVHLASEESETGILVEAMVQNPPPSSSGEDFILHKIDISKEAQFTFDKFSTAPILVIVSTEKDDNHSWVAAGRTIQRLLCRAASRGMTHCVSAAPTEVPPLLPVIRALSKAKGRPQLLFRLGYPQDASFTLESPRRSSQTIVS